MTNNPFDEVPESDRTVVRPTPGGRRGAAVPPTSPIGEASESDRTVVRPKPGGQRAPAPPPIPPAAPSPARPTPAAPVAATPAPVLEGAEDLAIGDNPLLSAATPLLQLLARLRNTANPPDSGDLRTRALSELRQFEQRARAHGVAMELLRPAHYVLCASLDDVVLNTPWGIEGAWAASPLCTALHQEAKPGERFFDLVGKLRQKPDQFMPVLELVYLCLSLGFMGRFRQSQRGPAEIDRLRDELCQTITAAKPAADAALSPQWQGIDAPYRPRRQVMPVWVVGSLALAVIGGMFLFVSTSLNAASDDLYQRVLASSPSAMPAIARAALVAPPPPPPPPPEPTAVDRLAQRLKPEIDQGLVSVLGTASAPMIRIGDQTLFPAASATLQSSATTLLQHIGAALAQEAGRVQVIGYTDNQPIHTVAFPSNFQLSAQRAQAVRSALARPVGDSKRLSSEGRAEADPVAGNTTPEGRAQNRRIDIVLHPPQDAS